MNKFNFNIIQRSIFVLDRNLPFVKSSLNNSNITEQEISYYQQIISRNFDNINSYNLYLCNDNDISNKIPKTNEEFDIFAMSISNSIYNLMIKNIQIANGDAVFLWASVNEKQFIFFFKLNYQKRMMHLVSNEGNIKLIENEIILPSAQQKIDEYFFIDIESSKTTISKINHTINGEYCNYLTRHIFDIVVDKTEGEIIKSIDDITISTIKEYYKEEPKKIMQYKNAIAENAKETGTIDVEDIKDTLFYDNTIAADTYRSKIEENGLPTKPFEISLKTEKKLTKKQKIITDNGIEILIPIEYLTDSNIFEYLQEPSGKLSLVIKGVSDINNK